MTEDFEDRSVPGGAGRDDPRHGDPAVTSIHDATQGHPVSHETALAPGELPSDRSAVPTVDRVTERRDDRTASRDANH